MDTKAKDFLFGLLNTPSPTGFESAGQKLWKNYVSRFSDSVETDAYGSAWARLDGQTPPLKIMLEAHADEIGYMVQNITDDGFIFVTRIGGSDRTIARGKRVRILGDKGPVFGIFGNTAIHLRDSQNEKVPEIHELFVDIGAVSKIEVEGRGVRVGHPLVYCDGAEDLVSDKLVGRAIDNRIGGFILAQVVERLSASPPNATVLAVNAVHEEIGGSGAKMISYRLEPDLAIVLDVTHATDSPGIDRNKHGTVKLGGGPTVTHGTANHPKVVARLIEIAAALDIPLQHETSGRATGTDTDLIFPTKSGIPSALISTPLRYMHSTVETVDLTDVDRCVALLVHFIRSFENVEQLKTLLLT